MKYINEFIKYKESKGEKAIYRVNDNCGNTYYGEDYVHWLEEQLRIHDVSGSLRLVSRNCVNSTWTASWLQKKGLDHCQCGFECKVRVQVERNGHPPYTYIVTKKEYNKLRKELVFQQ